MNPRNQTQRHPGAAPLPTTPCPECDYDMNDATAIDGSGRTPEAGDVSVCFNCGAMLEFNEILVLKPLPDDADLPDEVVETLAVASRAIRERGRLQ